MKARTKWGFASVCSIVVGLFWGCGGSLESRTGGESHFLIYCDDSCGAGLNCISGVCTRGCVVDEDSCTDLHPEADCTDASFEPGEVAVCDVACTDDAQCEGLGTNFSCESGQCRGDTAGASGTGGSASSGGTSSTTNAGGGSGPTCEHLFEEHPDGATFDNHAGCGTCTCEAGEAECTNSACQVGVRVFPCPADVQTDPIDVHNSFVQADTLLMYVAHSGGCEIHDYGLCFEPELGTSESTGRLAGELRLIHDSNGDLCEAYPSTTLFFDLAPYAEYVKGELDVPGAVVSTPFGLYAFGELGCDDRRFAAGWQVTEAADQTLSFGCSTAADCLWASTDLSCFTGCGAIVTAAGEQVFATTMDHIQATLCDPYDQTSARPSHSLPVSRSPHWVASRVPAYRSRTDPASSRGTSRPCGECELNGCTLQDRTGLVRQWREPMERAARIRDLTEHSDLRERLRSVPPAARIRGLYFKSTISVLSLAGKLDGYRELFTESYSSVGWFPMTDYLERLAVAAALLTSPREIDAGLYEIGRSNAAAFADSLLGRMMIRLLSRDPQKLLRQACASRRQSVEYGRWSVEFSAPRQAVVHMHEEYIWIASNLTGAAKGTFESIGLDATVDYALNGPYEGTHTIHW